FGRALALSSLGRAIRYISDFFEKNQRMPLLSLTLASRFDLAFSASVLLIHVRLRWSQFED
ncbi:MAG: hypothetical protein NWR83_02000, partial [Salibacteraceae bacterium]|nr:hypothetical protein [Salibacteraceae bacterium]